MPGRRIAAALALAASTSVAAAEDEALHAAGRVAFDPCRSCHALDADTERLPGPDLAGLIGRPLAGDPGFNYSPVLRAAR